MTAPERRLIIEPISVLKALAVFAALGLVYLLREVFALVFAALFLATILQPAASYLAKHRIPKGLTVLTLYVLLLSLTVFSFSQVVPLIAQQSSALVLSAGRLWHTLSIHIPQLQGISFNAASFQDQISLATDRLVTTVTDVVTGTVALVIVLVMAYYMVVQDEQAKQAFRQFMPSAYQDLVANILVRVQDKISRWLLGQFILCLTVGLLYAIGLSIIGLDGVLVLSLFGALTEFVPYLGPILGAIPVLLLAFSQSPLQAVMAFILVICIQQMENHVIVPKIMQKAVGLNPLVSIIALLVGARLFGVVGAILSIPLATSLSVVLSEWLRLRPPSQD